MKALHDYGKKRLQQLVSLLKNFSPANADDSLHDIRVEIKKIRTLLRLIHHCRPKFDDQKHYKTFRKIFRSAGAIRERRVTGALIKEFAFLEINETHQEKSEQLQRFTKKIPQYKKSVKKKVDLILSSLHKISSDAYEDYVEQKRKRLLQQLIHLPPAADLHALRKDIKELIYLFSVTKPEKEAPFKSFLTTLENLIGTWHDKIVALDYLQQKNISEAAVISPLREASNRELKDIYQYIHQHVGVWLSDPDNEKQVDKRPSLEAP